MSSETSCRCGGSRLRYAVLVALTLLAPLTLAAPPTPPTGAATIPIGWVSGGDMTYFWANQGVWESRVKAATSAAHLNTLYVDAKDVDGLVGWYSRTYPMALAGLVDGNDPIDKMATTAHSLPGVAAAARFALFDDARLAAKYPAARIGTTDWVDPASPDVQAELLGELADLASQHALDELSLADARYPDPDVEAPASTPLPVTGGTLGAPAQPLVDVIDAFVDRATATVASADPFASVSIDVFGRACDGAAANIGEDVASLAPRVSFLMPFLYPSQMGAAAQADPATAVRVESAKCVTLAAGSASIKPWIQGFGVYAANFTTVGAEITSAAAGGASGASVWWFPSMGVTDTPRWASLAPDEPALYVRAAPAVVRALLPV
ncbi:MAG: putative glycoside hydrolase [Thermoplasmatota archaeon]